MAANSQEVIRFARELEALRTRTQAGIDAGNTNDARTVRRQANYAESSMDRARNNFNIYVTAGAIV